MYYSDEQMIIERVKCGPYDNNAYLVICKETKESIIIDTPMDPKNLITASLKTTPKTILITHNHMDHIHGFTEVLDALKTKTGIGQQDAEALPSDPDFRICDDQIFSAGKLKVKAIYTPGHTPGSTCYLVNNQLFTGDTLFPGGPGKTQTPDNFQQIVQSITNKLFSLDSTIHFHPGHGEGSILSKSISEFEIFKSKSHDKNLCGDVEWEKS
ncbi:MAG: MBL fold metallo-hydrolase [Dehalococcoidia bacterium]